MNQFFLFCMFFFSVLAGKAQDKEAVLHTPAGDIYGTLTGPDSKTVVLIISGSGPTDRDGNNPMMKNNSLKMLAELLQKNGIASLRYDKRGIAQSKAAGPEETDIRLETYVNDAKEWVKYLKNNKHFKHILIAGHSEGALTGLLAAQANPDVNGYISIAGAGIPMGQLLEKQLKNQPQPVLDMCIPIIRKLEQGDTVGNVSPLLYSLFRPSVQPYLISCFKYNPALEITKLTQPVLIIQGTTDIQISTEDAEQLAKARPESRKTIIPNMNHVLKTCTTTDQASQIAAYSNPEMPLHPELEKVIIPFIQSIRQ